MSSSQTMPITARKQKYELLSNDIFNAVTSVRPTEPVKNIKFNYCASCDLPMEIANDEYQCTKCGHISAVDGTIVPETDHSKSSSSIRISNGSGRHSYINIISNYTKIQETIITNKLLLNNAKFQGQKIPKHILTKAANTYIDIQKVTQESDDKRKFVRRGAILDEVLGSIIYYECIRSKIYRKIKDIAIFMQLPNSGLSRGDDIIRGLHAEGKTDLPVDEEPDELCIDKYLEKLELDKPEYKNFVKEMLERSEDLKILLTSRVSSKITAMIWLLTTRLKKNTDISKVEKAADSIRKNTFLKFYKEVELHIDLFDDILTKYNLNTK